MVPCAARISGSEDSTRRANGRSCSPLSGVPLAGPRALRWSCLAHCSHTSARFCQSGAWWKQKKKLLELEEHGKLAQDGAR